MNFYDMNLYYGIIVLLFGIIIGSFLNVCIYRLPLELSVHKGHSYCPHCKADLHALDLIPLFSYLFLGGKCRYCKQHISWQYPAVELANGLLWLGIFLRFGLTATAVAYAAVVSCLIVIFMTDFTHMIIPDSMNLVIAIAGVVLFITNPDMRIERIIGMCCVSLVFLLIALVSHGKAMGGGDIKLMAALGLCLGWKLILLTTLLGAVLGSITYLFLKHSKAHALGRLVPFGAFLAIGGIISILFGHDIIHWYLSLIIIGHTHGQNGEIHMTHLE
ncbi:MAG: prepilin peptidase [Oscillospiraceae bacterium]